MADLCRDCSPQELHAKLAAKEDFVLVDVRTDEELGIASVDGARHIPLHEIPDRIDELREFAESEIVMMCHHGMRSANAQAFLQSSGFAQVRNLVGGIDAYAVEADPTVPRYG
jgi:rhodanese-related sulfurtransferase